MAQQHNPISPEISIEQHHYTDAEFRKRVRRTTIILSVITIIELAIGLTIYTLNKGDANRDFLILLFKGVVCILTLAKAYYIVSVFMHLGDEIRNMIMTIVVPLLLFVWFIIAFIADGNSYKKLRNDYDLHFKESTMDPKEAKREKQQQEPAKAPFKKE